MEPEVGKRGRLKASKQEFEITGFNAFTGKYTIVFKREYRNYVAAQEVEVSGDDLRKDAVDAQEPQKAYPIIPIA